MSSSQIMVNASYIILRLFLFSALSPYNIITFLFHRTGDFNSELIHQSQHIAVKYISYCL
ncbi:Uncharacterised protein [Escherichia coli]|uniref:Uncharacterized protein n=1 Tax=Escherichia coli TaxID=562 RepID=A0A376ZTQ9_ECOLX|nr:Uncharacterised protein [Escherichia coli]